MTGGPVDRWELRADRLLRRLARELQRSLPVRPHDDRVAVDELALEHGHRQRILNQPLDRPLERPRAERRIVAFLGEHALRLGRHLERDLALGEQLLEPRELEVDDLLDLLGAERVEDDDVVDAVEELGLERAAAARSCTCVSTSAQSPRACSRMNVEPTFDVMMMTVFRKSTVRPCESVSRPSSRICKQNVEHVRVRLLDLVEQDHRSTGGGEPPR